MQVPGLADWEFPDPATENSYVFESCRSSRSTALLLRLVSATCWLIAPLRSFHTDPWQGVRLFINLSMFLLDLWAARALALGKRYQTQEQTKVLIFLAGDVAVQTVSVLAPPPSFFNINITVLPAILTVVFLTFSQVRLMVALRLHICNVVIFACLQINAFVMHRSWLLISRDVLTYLLAGLLLPLAVTYHTEYHGRRIFITKMHSLSPSQVGPRWQTHLV